VSRALRRGLAVLALTVLLADLASCARKKIYREGVSRIEAVVGETIVIELEANPTTGYTWTVRGRVDTGVVALMGFDFEPGPTSVVGGGGRQQIIFQAVGRGTTTIRLEYRRQWEETTPERSETVTLVVR